MKRFLIYFLGMALTIYMGLSLLVYTQPHYFIYHPHPIKPSIEPAQRVIPDLHEVQYKTADNRFVYAWYAVPKNAEGTIVFLHGNSYNLSAFVNRIEPFYNAGYAVIMPEYTGFGGREGIPTQPALEQDVAATIQFLHEQGISNTHIILYGYSLGTYLATYAAADLQNGTPFRAVVLESPFTSLADTASWTTHYIFPMNWLLTDRYPSIDKIQKINTRLFIGHGKQDAVVPYFMGEKLFETAHQPKTFFSVPQANHRTLPQHGFSQAVLKWLNNG